MKAALYSREILHGSARAVVHHMGPRVLCEWCRAEKWESELSSTEMCCLRGKIRLLVSVRNVETSEIATAENFIHDLWMNTGDDGKLARKYARQLNNCLTLASQVVNEASLAHGSFQPCFTIHGRLYHKFGSLVPPVEGATPVFAQIYVFDGEHSEERTLQYRRTIFHVPANMSQIEEERLNCLIRRLELALRICNPYILDFQAIMAFEISGDEVEHAK